MAESTVRFWKSGRSPFGVRRWPTARAQTWAECAFDILCSDSNVVAVVLLGSSIRPVNSSFDLDCLYIYRGSKPSLPPVPMEVDLRGYPVGRIDELVGTGHDLLVWAILLGSPVCERDGYWTDLVQRWKQHVPYPTPEAAEKRAADAERLYEDLQEMGDEDAAIEQLVTALTHRGRAALLRADVFPASRPELPGQLRNIGQHHLADVLSSAINERNLMAQRCASSLPASNELA